jgi:hypothetical protein
MKNTNMKVPVVCEVFMETATYNETTETYDVTPKVKTGEYVEKRIARVAKDGSRYVQDGNGHKRPLYVDATGRLCYSTHARQVMGGCTIADVMRRIQKKAGPNAQINVVIL